MAKVTPTFNPFPEEPCIKSVNELGNQIAARLSFEIPNTFSFSVKSTTPPTDKTVTWQRVTPAGEQLDYHFFNGFWVRSNTPQIGTVREWSGDPTGFFDANGKGNSGSGNVALDWFGWQLCNGNNGTKDLRDKFVICQNDLVTPYSGGEFRTNVTTVPTTNGGEYQHTLTVQELAKHQHGMLLKDIDGGPSGGGNKIDIGDYDPNFSPNRLITDFAGEDQPHNNMPPYYTLAFIQYIGYA